MFKHLFLALVLITEVGTVVMKVAVCPISISTLGTAQGAVEQASPCITGATSWRLQQLQLSQLLVSNLNPPVKKINRHRNFLM